MTLAKLPTPPEGFEIVTEGSLRPGDLAWNPSDETWGKPNKYDFEALGRQIPYYYAVARKTKSSP
ncbi:hypothetical protein [Pseudomonas amygdali]|uniref:Uncharacterized protein n=2 Tax=Pseudomonas amygdali pv. lachrymans TaxID=53707 RepID=A0ABR5KR53_PSEAV|nr:hypothetical protein [Pseudomonas amygdali]AXH59873.1 hypothetical protein PLA107_032120 [Pseudomonas amygdali pv. lachrymans str. M301315]KPC17287.1 Uncharacterized protein AC499_0489 [Pseudomonas amygdali pv. lachrymans]